MTDSEHQNLNSDWHSVCHTSDLADGDTRGVEINGMPLIVLKQKDEWRVFVNSCPHLGIRLEWQPHQFLDIDGHYLQCSSHGALFRPDNGVCISGPCQHEALQAVKHRIEQGQLWINLAQS